ncbi:MAG TPA: branched-chain amino acid aminotransferase [Cyclobacteriaceae bacterium]|nr:branched-chain amino acid aminotransferase [Cyclobacteriaceae bacterium]
MTAAPALDIQKTTHSRLAETDFNNLEFGKYIADHMVLSDWKGGHWSKPVIVPFGELRMTPAILALHYGQAIFEGMKAFRRADGSITIFRPEKHHDRMNKSLNRMCMPSISYEMFIQTLHDLISLDRAWVPGGEGALYLRPLVFASESRLGVKVADQYKYVVLTSPVGPYYSKPFRLKVEDHYTRTAEGGPGFAKCAGNYGGAFYPTQVARQEGFDQVLWTDHKEHKYIDEVGMMNVMFVLNGKLVTPKLSSAILDGITRDSILTLAREAGITVEERRVSVDELAEGFKNKSLTEAFGAGTAAVVAPIAVINIHGTDYSLPPVAADSIQLRMKATLAGIRNGSIADKHNWNYIIPA